MDYYLTESSIPEGVTLCRPMKMHTYDVMVLYNHIYMTQDNETPAFDFRSNIAELSQIGEFDDNYLSCLALLSQVLFERPARFT